MHYESGATIKMRQAHWQQVCVRETFRLGQIILYTQQTLIYHNRYAWVNIFTDIFAIDKMYFCHPDERRTDNHFPCRSSFVLTRLRQCKKDGHPQIQTQVRL